MRFIVEYELTDEEVFNTDYPDYPSQSVKKWDDEVGRYISPWQRYCSCEMMENAVVAAKECQQRGRITRIIIELWSNAEQ